MAASKYEVEEIRANEVESVLGVNPSHSRWSPYALADLNKALENKSMNLKQKSWNVNPNQNLNLKLWVKRYQFEDVNLNQKYESKSMVSKMQIW